MNPVGMKYKRRSKVRYVVVGAVALAAFLSAGGAQAQTAATIINFTQVGCQFLESEKGIDHGYMPKSKKDCEAINEQTAAARLENSTTLRLKPGRCVFRVANRNVPYDLGSWLRGEGLLNRARLPSVAGGGLSPGATREYEIDLVEGEYVYSYPLNPTPDYRLVVSG